MKKIALFTGSRAEFSLQLPLLKRLKASKEYEVALLIGASHLDSDYGETVSEIVESGFDSKYQINFNHSKDDLSSNPQTISIGITLISKELEHIKPDYFIIYGDRYETFAAAIASSQMGIPTIHIEGGDVTEGGTFDDSVRHAITKLSHIHLATNELSKNRIIKMGEESKRVFNVGLPIIDLIKNKDFTNGKDVVKKYNLENYDNLIIFTQHSIPIEINNIEKEFKEIISSFQKIKIKDLKIICTYPNSDIGGKKIIDILNQWEKTYDNISVFKSLGRRDLHGLLNLNNITSDKNVIFIGNSSSAIKEAPYLNCPSLILGSRQNGRLHSSSVYFTDIESESISNNIDLLFDNVKLNQSKNEENYYGEGNMAGQTLTILNNLPSRKELLLKKFN